MIKKIIMISIIMVLLCTVIEADVIQKQVPKKIIYVGIIGTYDDYDPIANFSVQKTNSCPYIYLNGTITENNNTYIVGLTVLPIPPSIPARPALMYGFVNDSLVNGAVCFYGDNMCHIIGSFACENLTGWFSGDLQ
jgi:hypothetical protein